MAQPSYPADRDPAFNLTSGPSGATPATLAALGRPILHHLDPAFGALYQQTVELLQQAFGTSQSAVILQGEAVVGLEAAAASLIGPRDVVLNLVSGMYGRGYGDWARRYALEVIEIEVPYDSSVPAVSVADAFRLRPDITVVCVVHCETPSGTVNDLDAISAGRGRARRAAHRQRGLHLRRHPLRLHRMAGQPGRDRAAEVPGRPWPVPAARQRRAWVHMTANPAAPRGSVLSILDWRHAHLADRPFPFTPSVTDIYGLRACLEQYLLEGAEAVLGRHRPPPGPRGRAPRPWA